jgi:transposase
VLLEGMPGSITGIGPNIETKVNPNLLHRWRKEVREHAVKAFPGLGIKRAEEERVAQLERKVGQQALEIDFLRRCWQHAAS